MADEAAKKAKAAEKAAKQESRAAKRAQGKQTRSQLWGAFKMLAKEDKSLIPLLLLAWLGTAVAFFLVGLIWNGQWWMLALGLAFGLVLAFWLFTRRLQANMYERVDDQPGAAGWVLDNLRSNVGVTWVAKSGVAANTQMDSVHRVVGNPGVVFVGEGNPHRLKAMMAQQVKRADRVLGGVPIFEVYVGNDTEAGQVPLKKLERHLIGLPRNYKKDQVYAIAAKVDALDRVGGGQQAGMPKGPLPKQAQNMAGMNRRMRRASERKGK
ncbi:DUF4191 domain-containing protein [Corynebacterium guangdongense]|uniref:Membrane protein implicated in regulation of membrane protease activity n=1 Tax=Corynebacterium guangdongense TaxID=1783348 RepID=A0ABU1ZXZ9_9CORY|nr:DUF4191 domain-containing protein [Corynebacterium guangdongense]MDR7329786.1 membrane protein implicated in regulation of membrane protease activity [Corynebacterium guangdongense]WJZ18349.1 hypothetical protein CGUA_08940 [Corynebacterium guangdongense]